MPSASESSSRNDRTVLVTPHRELVCRPTRATASASSVTALSSWIIEPWPGRAARGQPHPGMPFSAVSIEVEPQVVVDGEGEAADLADRLGAALEQVRVVVDQPAARRRCRRPPRRRGRRARRRAAACARCASRSPDDRQHHRVHVLHVDRAAAPDAAVAISPENGCARPVGRVGRHDVEVAVDQQRRPATGRRPRSGRPRWPGPGATRGSAARGRPRRASPRRTRRRPARRARGCRRSWWCRSGSGRGTARRPRPARPSTAARASPPRRRPPASSGFRRRSWIRSPWQ